MSDLPDFPAIRTYEVLTRDLGQFRLSIPEDWKVTYGPVVGAKSNGGSYHGNALRVWESDTKQRVMIMDVIQFCDLSVQVQIRAIRPHGSQKWYRASTGVAGEFAWKDPEEVVAGIPDLVDHRPVRPAGYDYAEKEF